MHAPELIPLTIPCASCGQPAAYIALPRPQDAPNLLAGMDPVMRTILAPVMQRAFGMLEKWQRAGGRLEETLPGALSRHAHVQCARCGADGGAIGARVEAGRAQLAELLDGAAHVG